MISNLQTRKFRSGLLTAEIGELLYICRLRLLRSGLENCSCNTEQFFNPTRFLHVT